MGLRLKFNIVLTVVFAAGMGVSAFVSYELLQSNAKQEVLRSAGLMMEAALSVRGYTVTQVKPLLAPLLTETFLPQTVSAYAATEIQERHRHRWEVNNKYRDQLTAAGMRFSGLSPARSNFLGLPSRPRVNSNSWTTSNSPPLA